MRIASHYVRGREGGRNSCELQEKWKFEGSYRSRRKSGQQAGGEKTN